MSNTPTPHSDSEQLYDVLEQWLEDAYSTSSLGVSIDDDRDEEDRKAQYYEYRRKAKTALIQWANRRAEKLVVEELLNEYKKNRRWFECMAEYADVKADAMAEYDDRIAALTATKEEG